LWFPDYKTKYEDNPDPHTPNLAFERITKKGMLKRRKGELEPCKLYAGDEAFSASWLQSIKNYIDNTAAAGRTE
jgi:type I restriction enzyme R subunit